MSIDLLVTVIETAVIRVAVMTGTVGVCPRGTGNAGREVQGLHVRV